MDQAAHDEEEDRPVTAQEHWAVHRMPGNRRLKCRMIGGQHVCPRSKGFIDELVPDEELEDEDAEEGVEEGEN